jgi:hypothetical protein
VGSVPVYAGVAPTGGAGTAPEAEDRTEGCGCDRAPGGGSAGLALLVLLLSPRRGSTSR